MLRGTPFWRVSQANVLHERGHTAAKVPIKAVHAPFSATLAGNAATNGPQLHQQPGPLHCTHRPTLACYGKLDLGTTKCEKGVPRGLLGLDPLGHNAQGYSAAKAIDERANQSGDQNYSNSASGQDHAAFFHSWTGIRKSIIKGWLCFSPHISFDPAITSPLNIAF